MVLKTALKEFDAEDNPDQLAHRWMMTAYIILNRKGYNPLVVTYGDGFTLWTKDELLVMVWEDGGILVSDPSAVVIENIPEDERLTPPKCRRPDYLQRFLDAQFKQMGDGEWESPTAQPRTADEIIRLIRRPRVSRRGHRA